MLILNEWAATKQQARLTARVGASRDLLPVANDQGVPFVELLDIRPDLLQEELSIDVALPRTRRQVEPSNSRYA
jgi:hypothetical protein